MTRTGFRRDPGIAEPGDHNRHVIADYSNGIACFFADLLQGHVTVGVQDRIKHAALTRVDPDLNCRHIIIILLSLR